jgi:hypothetical protein
MKYHGDTKTFNNATIGGRAEYVHRTYRNGVELSNIP